MVLWDVTLVTASYGQYSAYGAATLTNEYDKRAGSLLRRQISVIRNKRALFTYNDTCHVNYSAHSLCSK